MDNTRFRDWFYQEGKPRSGFKDAMFYGLLMQGLMGMDPMKIHGAFMNEEKEQWERQFRTKQYEDKERDRAFQLSKENLDIAMKLGDEKLIKKAYGEHRSNMERLYDMQAPDVMGRFTGWKPMKPGETMGDVARKTEDIQRFREAEAPIEGRAPLRRVEYQTALKPTDEEKTNELLAKRGKDPEMVGENVRNLYAQYAAAGKPVPAAHELTAEYHDIVDDQAMPLERKQALMGKLRAKKTAYDEITRSPGTWEQNTESLARTIMQAEDKDYDTAYKEAYSFLKDQGTRATAQVDDTEKAMKWLQGQADREMGIVGTLQKQVLNDAQRYVSNKSFWDKRGLADTQRKNAIFKMFPQADPGVVEDFFTSQEKQLRTVFPKIKELSYEKPFTGKDGKTYMQRHVQYTYEDMPFGAVDTEITNTLTNLKDPQLTGDSIKLLDSTLTVLNSPKILAAKYKGINYANPEHKRVIDFLMDKISSNVEYRRLSDHLAEIEDRLRAQRLSDQWIYGAGEKKEQAPFMPGL